ncbi:hypothetical protein MX551_003653 [Salmonella enterica]|nr:hypothetical protein [Salmonella enterica]EEU4805584.1 hypothetical protein [Salmonella enterica]EEU4869119.1 hypothetical protein [Salmonella enterica]EEU4896451.1 hypothetical protein [Salmonella enterica]EJC1069262.1 hypothetical protein [Salmonella enterica]
MSEEAEFLRADRKPPYAPVFRLASGLSGGGVASLSLDPVRPARGGIGLVGAGIGE